MSGKIAARLAMLTALAALMLAATTSRGVAASPARVPISGVLPHAGARLRGLRAAARAASANDLFLQDSPCSPSSTRQPCWVMRTNTTYAIYWMPSGYSVGTNYEGLLNRYLNDVAAASGSQTNVYSVATQYYDATGFIGYRSTFGGAYVDTDPFPVNGCDDSYNGVQDAVCLTDRQLQTEIQSVITAKGWQNGQDALFLIMTPEGVGSCYDSTSPNLGGQCTTNYFCAYHSGFRGANGEPVIYANEPYDGDIDHCHDRGGQGSPNDPAADATINAISHEQNESISDPWGNAWLNADGDEMADLCVWQFGSALGTADGQPYDQLINGHPYELQEEYSNDGSTCLQHYVGLPANTALPALSGVAVQGQPLSASQGSWTQRPTAYAYRWLRCAAKGNDCAAIAGATSATHVAVAADVGHRLEARVAATNARGTTRAVSKISAVVVGRPASREAPRISGSARVGQRLSAGKGAWSGPPQTYRFQWLRCNAHGGSCIAIGRATHSAYRLTKHDARHRLRVQVTALNAAGSRTATSRATAPVPAAEH